MTILGERFRLKNLLRANRASLAKGVGTLIAVDVLIFSLPLFVKTAIDIVQAKPLPHWLPAAWQSLPKGALLLVVVALYLSVNAIIAYIRYWWRVYLIWSSFPLLHGRRRDLYQHIQSLDRDFFRHRKIGDLLSALTNDTENLRMSLSIGALMFIDALINFILFPVLLWQLDPLMTSVIVPPLVVIALVMTKWSEKLSTYYEQIQSVTADLSARAFEMMSGIRVIKAYRRERAAHAEFSVESRKLRDVSLRAARLQSLFVPLLQGAIAVGVFVVLVWGGTRVMRGELLLSNLVAFQLYLRQLDWPMMAMGWTLQLVRKSDASEKRLQEIANTESSLVTHSIFHENEPMGDAPLVKISSLEFEYPSNNKFRIEIPSLTWRGPGWVGVTGAVGSGKSTFLELLARQRDPHHGKIEFRGRDLKTSSTEEWSEQILCLSQESFLFSRSLKNNLALGLSERPSDDELWSLLKDLRFDRSLLSDRGGLWTRCGERGVSFSGGQKQRIALARALLRKRSLYLFDDVFSHVDVETEAHLREVVRQRIPPTATVFLVSQRLETLSFCDEVIVFRRGKIEFQGRPEDALKQSAFYARLETLQEAVL